MKRGTIIFICRNPAFKFRRWGSTSCLSWPLKNNVRLSRKLLEIENYWKDRLEKDVIKGNSTKPDLPSKYVLAMFPYPSGRLHIGHLRVYSISDVCSRYYALRGHPTLHPIGWDAFGLPAENAAREHGVDAAQWTFDNIKVMREQLRMTGINFDWDREIATCKSDYYRWTQWLFLRLYERGFVRRALAEVFWDPVDNTVLAAEQVDSDGRSWRSRAFIERRRLHHWIIETPKYAKRLLDGLEALKFDWGEVAAIQAYWIGKCDVYRFLLPIQDAAGVELPDERFDLRIFNPSEILTARFLFVTNEHSLVVQHRQKCSSIDTEDFYLLPERIFNPFNGLCMPIVVVPKEFASMERRDEIGGRFVMNARLANSTRTNAFDQQIARRFGLDAPELAERRASADEILLDAKSQGVGGYLTSRILHDWVVSRQRAWGTPIPMLFDEESRRHPLPVTDDRLPILLEQRGNSVDDTRFPSGRGVLETDTLDTFFDSSWYFLRFLDPRNSNALADDRVLRTRMPVDLYVGGVEHADVHLFFARFVSHFLHKEMGLLNEPEPFRRLIPQGIVRGRTFRMGDAYLRSEEVEERPAGSNTFVQKSSGEVVSCQYEKMSKSKHNGVDPLALIEVDGIDLARLQLLYAAAPRQLINWGATQEADKRGLRRFLDRCATVVNIYVKSRNRGITNLETTPDETLEKFCRDQRNECTRMVSIAIDMTNVHNKAIERLQIFASALKNISVDSAAVSVEFEKAVHALVIMLQIFAPHVAAELWSALSSVPSKLSPRLWQSEAAVTAQKWPDVDEDAIIDFAVSIGTRKLSCRARRDVIEPLGLEDIVNLGKTKYFIEFFKLLREYGITVNDIKLQKQSGLQVTLELQLVAENSELISELFDKFVKKRK